MRYTQKTTALILAATMILSGCSKADTHISTSYASNVTEVTEETGEQVKEPYYTSVLITIPQETAWLHPFQCGEDAGIVCGNWGKVIDEKTGERENSTYNLYICGYDGTIKSQCRLENDDDNGIVSCADLGNGTFVVSTCFREFLIYDYDGKIIRRGDKLKDNVHAGICNYDGGFAVVTTDSVKKFDTDGNLIDSVDIGNYDNYYIQGLFEQDGELYAFGDNNDYCGFFRIDFNMGTVEECFAVKDIQNDIYPGYLPNFDTDYFYQNTFYCAELGPAIVKVDLKEQKYRVLAHMDHVFVVPPSDCEYDCPDLAVLDDTHFMNYRTSISSPDPNECGPLAFTEVALVSRNDDLDMDNREEILIQGAGVTSDTTLGTAAYYYNMGQDKYFVRLEDLSGKLDYTSVDAMKRSTLSIMSGYMNGNTPDIFYGNTFDYIYFGENGLAADMSPYVDTSCIDPHILELMTGEDGKIYQIFTSYGLNGYWGKEKLYGNCTDLSSMPSLKNGQRRFAEVYTVDLLYDILGSDLRTMYKSGNLTYGNILQDVRSAVENGRQKTNDPEDYVFSSREDVGKDVISLYKTVVSNASVYYELSLDYKDTPSFIGYPSAQGSSYQIVPHSLIALSASARNPKACGEFISYVMSEENQRRAASSGSFPVNGKILQEYLDIMQDPDSASPELKQRYATAFCHDYSDSAPSDNIVKFPAGLADSLMEQIKKADYIEVYDWGVYKIISDEIDSYYNQSMSVEDIAKNLESRLKVYAAENFG